MGGNNLTELPAKIGDLKELRGLYVCGNPLTVDAIKFAPQAIRVYKYTKIQGPRFQRNNIIAREKKVSDLHGTSFQSSPKVNRMLITRAIYIQ